VYSETCGCTVAPDLAFASKKKKSELVDILVTTYGEQSRENLTKSKIKKEDLVTLYLNLKHYFRTQPTPASDTTASEFLETN
jgi:hypothetical protein